jgi:hypothetical protein
MAGAPCKSGIPVPAGPCSLAQTPATIRFFAFRRIARPLKIMP